MNKKKKILISHFRSLNNYGTGMMGLATIQALIDKYGENGVTIYCDFDESVNIDDVKNELGININLIAYSAKKKKIGNTLLRRIFTLFSLLFSLEYKKFDEVVVLGGDDLSEFYGKYDAIITIWNGWKNSFFTKLFFIGQTIGPFQFWWNRLAVRLFVNKLRIFSRDLWTVDYLKNEFNCHVEHSADLALSDLPLQHDLLIEKNTLNEYGLKKNHYLTMVVSGLVKEGYYCKDEQSYLLSHAKMIQLIFAIRELSEYKVVLLAHTFPPYGDEAELINKLYALCPEKIKSNIVVIDKKILQTRARFIIGNGLFTITGRMHPAVSSFQMGKPAICLSYSKKYHGVIGLSIGRDDLIIDANDQSLWENGEIELLVIEKVNYILKNKSILETNINKNVCNCKKLVKKCLDEL